MIFFITYTRFIYKKVFKISRAENGRGYVGTYAISTIYTQFEKLAYDNVYVFSAVSFLNIDRSHVVFFFFNCKRNYT